MRSSTVLSLPLQLVFPDHLNLVTDGDKGKYLFNG